jgi:hypothetical protein
MGVEIKRNEKVYTKKSGISDDHIIQKKNGLVKK